MVELSSTEAPRETGGIFVGRYVDSNRVARVTEMIDPPTDSESALSSFWRGEGNLAEQLKALWAEGKYYLGEWHSHPGMSPRPSGLDRQRMQKIQRDPDYNCAVPILSIIGWGLAADHVAVFAFPPDGPAERLNRVDT